MCKDQKFFYCKHCGNMVGLIHASGAPMSCCGEPMTELVPNTVDAAKEKHLPVVKQEGNIVEITVGEVAHPMTDDHYIAWVYLQTTNGGHRITLKPGDAPVVKVALVEGEEVIAALEYCTLHGIWLTEVYCPVAK